MGVAFVVELLRPHASSKRPRSAEMRPMLRVGRQIFVRTAALYASFLVAASVLARVGDAPLGAHQIAFQLFIFLALLLDAVAIAGQVIVGRMLGAGDPVGAYAAARADDRLVGRPRRDLRCSPSWRSSRGCRGCSPSDPAVLHSAAQIWVLFAVMQPLAGAVFALDGILIGASDTSYLMWSMLAASLGVFIPIALASLAFDWGIVGVWAGLDALIAARLALPRDTLRRPPLGGRRLDVTPGLTPTAAAARSGCTASATSSRPDTSPSPRRPRPSRR